MSGSNRRRHYSDKKSSAKGTFIAKVPIVMLSMILSGLLLLLVSAYFALKTNSPLSLTAPLSLAALYLSSFIGGAVCAFLLEDPGSYVCALISSSVFTIITLISKLIIPKPESIMQTGPSIVLHVLIIAACLGGVFVTQRIRYRNKRRHKTRR